LKSALDLNIYKKIQELCADIDITILINNAGVGFSGYFKETTHHQIRELALVNTYPYVLLTKALLGNLIKNKNSKTCIINLSSSASF